MLKKFLIHEEDKEPVGELIYDTNKEEFTLSAYTDKILKKCQHLCNLWFYIINQ